MSDETNPQNEPENNPVAETPDDAEWDNPPPETSILTNSVNDDNPNTLISSDLPPENRSDESDE